MPTVNEFKNRLGRLIHYDERDKNFLVPKMAVSPSVRHKFYPTGPILDQGNTPQCVAYSSVQFLMTGPVVNHYPEGPPDLYTKCQLIDEWKDSPHDGTSVRASMQVLQAVGYLSEYNWAYDVGTVVNYLLTRGPMVLGTNWSEDMFNPDEKGFIRYTGTVVGGHAYLLMGVNLDLPCSDGTKGAFRMQNSWGMGWGNGPSGGSSRAWVSISDVDKLIKDDGEAATSVELHV